MLARNDENANPINQVQKKKASATAGNAAGKTIEQIYTKKTQLEHILLRPDTYIGSVEKQTQSMWVLNSDTRQIENKSITFVPGLYKIFDEIVVNAADNKQRDAKMDRLEVTINSDENLIRVWNNGSGIPIAMHQEHNIYVPELIFGNLLTGSNFDDEEQKTTGGRNGYGAKLANIFSTQFIVETADSSRGLKYKQVFCNNMGSKADPEITSYSGKDYTCITFYPDLKRFKMDYMDDDTVALLSKRVYDVSATNTAAGAKLNVFLNGARIDIRTFESYISIHSGLDTPCVFERVNERWEIGVGVSEGTFTQVSYVNSICTIKGGCHVNYIAEQITSKLASIIKKKNKGEEVKANFIKNHLAIYVNALITNPAFDSQTKENLTTKVSAFGSTCLISDKLIKTLEKSELIDNILAWSKTKQSQELKKKSGKKASKVIGITKLDDANFAGTSKSMNCTLILTEGDSAKALAISGLGVVGRDYYGVFPLKGKLLNVREATHQQMLKNEEITNIVKILGLEFNKTYTNDNISSLRYGHLMIMTDQDHDGSHIKGLLINFIHYYWPSLLKVNGFLQQFITPIVKCTKGEKTVTFYTLLQYESWREEHNDGKGWKIKYYKGLGTSTSAEAKDYFSNLSTHEIDFRWEDGSDHYIELAFAKKCVDDRKLWLLGMKRDVYMDYEVESITYEDFVNHELIQFSHADNERSIPHFMDGLKPSQRKVLYGCFKRNLKNELKVAQLAGYISENTAYHHGEVSLTSTIVAMAQNFTGSNNINLLSPCGQFGTRLMGGKDAASSRYIFTRLESIARCIFHPSDDPLLTYLDDDGQSIEPFCYVPVIPMALINGSEGIGTGWSTSVPTYNPRDVINNLRLMIAGQQPADMQPWFRGFTGAVQAKTGRDSSGSYIVSGTIEQIDETTVVISELPVGKWTTDYKQFLESMIIGADVKAVDGATSAPAIIKDFRENHTDTAVLFTVTMPPDKMEETIKFGLQKRFKLDTSVGTSNMNMFDMNSMIHKYEGPLEILQCFYDLRIQFYDKRKQYLMSKLRDELEKLDNRVRFITSVCDNKLVVSNRKKSDLLADLKASGYREFFDSKAKDDVDDDAVETANRPVTASLDKGYDYLLSMKIWSLTMEKVAELIKQRNEKRGELDELSNKTIEELWLTDLDELEAALDTFDQTFDDAKAQEAAAQKKAVKNHANRNRNNVKKLTSKGSKAKALYSDDDVSDLDGDDDVSDYDEVKPKKKTLTHKQQVATKATVSAVTAVKPAVKSTSSVASVAKAIDKAAVVVPVPAPVSQSLSLAERLSMKKTVSAPTSAFSVPSAAVTSKPVIVTSSYEDDVKAKSKPHRVAAAAAAAARKKVIVDSDSDGDECSFNDDDDSESYDSSDRKTKKTAPKKVAASKSTASSSSSSAAAVTAAATVPSKGVKRTKKTATNPTKEVYSPVASTPTGTKKQKKTAATKQPARKALVKKRILSDSDEDAFNSDSDVQVIVTRSPKPVRQRAASRKYVVDDDEEEEDDFGDDESEYDESD